MQVKTPESRIKRCRKSRKEFREKLETVRSKFTEKVRPELMPSVVSKNKREMKNYSAVDQNRLNGKLDELSKRPDRPLAEERLP